MTPSADLVFSQNFSIFLFRHSHSLCCCFWRHCVLPDMYNNKICGTRIHNKSFVPSTENADVRMHSLPKTDRHITTTVKSDMQYLYMYIDLVRQLQNSVWQLPYDKRDQWLSAKRTEKDICVDNSTNAPDDTLLVTDKLCIHASVAASTSTHHWQRMKNWTSLLLQAGVTQQCWSTPETDCKNHNMLKQKQYIEDILNLKRLLPNILFLLCTNYRTAVQPVIQVD